MMLHLDDNAAAWCSEFGIDPTDAAEAIIAGGPASRIVIPHSASPAMTIWIYRRTLEDGSPILAVVFTTEEEPSDYHPVAIFPVPPEFVDVDDPLTTLRLVLERHGMDSSFKKGGQTITERLIEDRVVDRGGHPIPSHPSDSLLLAMVCRNWGEGKSRVGLAFCLNATALQQAL